MVLKELVIDRKSGEAVSSQIAQYVKSKIDSNELSPGQKLPTTQELVERFGVGTHTIRKAMYDLGEEGLVESTRRRGTFVRGAISSSNKNSNKVRRIGVAGLLQQAGEKMRYRPETAEGIIRECDRLNVCSVNLPNYLGFQSKEDYYRELVSLGCEGLIFLSQVPADKELINYLTDKRMPVITARRFRYNDGRPCIETDYDGAGFDVGRYFYSFKCDRIEFFSHFSLNCSIQEADRNGYPMGLKHGITRAFEMKGRKADINVHVNKEETVLTSDNIYSVLAMTPRTSGLVFTSGYQLLQLFRDMGQKARDILRGRKIAAVSNKTINVSLEHFVSGQELMVLVDPYEEIGKLLVAKLMGMIEGYFDEVTTTLVNIKFERFEKLMAN
jgi:DNA-binding transcriptional regulator YhcF (GntR family)